MPLAVVYAVLFSGHYAVWAYVNHCAGRIYELSQVREFFQVLSCHDKRQWRAAEGRRVSGIAQESVHILLVVLDLPSYIYVDVLRPVHEQSRHVSSGKDYKKDVDMD